MGSLISITTVIAIIFVFGLLVFVHELGHFLTAKFTGMRVDEFAIGFGPKLASVKKGETVYSLRVIPLGGFNKIAGMDPDEEQDEKSFYAKSVWSRMLVIVAGSFMNFVLPVLLLFVVYLSNGLEKVSEQPILGEILPGKPAAAAGLLAGDKILTVNGAKINTWLQFVEVIQKNAAQKISIDFERGGVTKNASVVPEFDEKANRALIGVQATIETYRPGVLESAGLAVKQTVFVIGRMLAGLYEMVAGKAEADIAGPIGVMKMTGEVARHGLIPLLQFAAFLSINLGLINLFPIPALDGGHIVVLAIEAVRRKPLNRRYLEIVHTMGFALLIIIMILATFKDITR